MGQYLLVGGGGQLGGKSGEWAVEPGRGGGGHVRGADDAFAVEVRDGRAHDEVPVLRIIIDDVAAAFLRLADTSIPFLPVLLRARLVRVRRADVGRVSGARRLVQQERVLERQARLRVEEGGVVAEEDGRQRPGQVHVPLDAAVAVPLDAQVRQELHAALDPAEHMNCRLAAQLGRVPLLELGHEARVLVPALLSTRLKVSSVPALFEAWTC